MPSKAKPKASGPSSPKKTAKASSKSQRPAKKAATDKSATRAAIKTDDSKEIDKQIADIGDWRGAALSHVRSLIKQADPEVVEELKWRKPSNAMMGVPVWSHDGMICTGETYKDKIKLTFAKGASVKDPARLFNSSLEGGTRRAIDIFEGDKIDEDAFKALIRDAVILNAS